MARDIDRFFDRECNTSGCEIRGTLMSPAGMQTVYESGDAMNAAQRCPVCLDNISSFMLQVSRMIRDQQGGTDPKPETTELYRRIGKGVLVMDAKDLRIMARFGGLLGIA